MDRKNRDLTDSTSEVPPAGALVSAKIYDASGTETVIKGFVLKKSSKSQTSLFSSVSVYLLATHTTETIFTNQIIEVLSYPTYLLCVPFYKINKKDLCRYMLRRLVRKHICSFSGHCSVQQGTSNSCFNQYDFA